jgi:hypothetical protein
MRLNGKEGKLLSHSRIRKSIIFCVPLFTIFTFIGYANTPQKNKLELKITGGISRVTGTDYEAVSDGRDRLNKISTEAAGGIFSSERNSFDWGGEVAGEIVFNLGSQFALSGGVGYIAGEFSNTRMSTHESVTTGSSGISFKAKAVPVTAGINYFLPVSSESRIIIGACVDYYFASFSSSSYRENNTPYRQDTDSKGSGGDFGFHGGVAFEYDLSKKVAVVIEGFGRYAKIRGFEGNRNQNDTNNVRSSTKGKYYTHERFVWTDEWHTRVSIGPDPPTGEDVRNVRDYEMDFSGFTIRIGLKIKLF